MADNTEEVGVTAPERNPFATQEIEETEQLAEVKQAEVPETNEQQVEQIDTATKPEEVKPTENKEEVAEVKKEAISFANEQSEKFFNLLKEGKEDELFNFLQEKRTLSSIDTMSAEDTIKLNLKYANPEYSAEEIQSLYEETYERPEKPEQGEFQEDDEYQADLAKWEKKNKTFENKLSREAKVARKELAAKNSELILPDIEKAGTPEPTAEEIAEMDKVYNSYLQSIDKGLSEISGYSTVLKDGQVEIPVNYSITDEEKTQLKAELQDFNVQTHFRERWVNPDGSWNGKQYADDVYWFKNRDKILQKVATEAASQRLAQHIKEQKNIDYRGGEQASFQPTAVNEKAKMAEFFFSQ